MNVNGSKFHMLLGVADWELCTANGKSLSVEWSARESLGADITVANIDQSMPAWDIASSRLSLAQIPEEVPATPNEQILTAADRRAAAVDRFGNIYAISATRDAIEVFACGAKDAARYWPDGRYGAATPPELDFLATDIAAPVAPLFSALAVTTNDFLVAAFDAGGHFGLICFDLAAGGDPGWRNLDHLVAAAPAELVSDACGGLWLFEPGANRILRLDSEMQPRLSAVPGEIEDLFQPDQPGARRVHTAALTMFELAIPAGLEAVHLIAGCGDELLLLARRTDQRSEILTLDHAATAWRSLGAIDHPYVMFGRAADGWKPAEATEALFCVPPSGNQAFGFEVLRDDDCKITELKQRAWLMPMRRFGGRGLIFRAPSLLYDSGTDSMAWIPLARLKRNKFAAANRFETRIFDSEEPQCVWDRIRLDACIPPGTQVRIEARCADEKNLLDASDEMSWVEQPQPYLNGDHGELPGKRALAMPDTDTEHSTGCWDVLLQNAVGRYLKLRIILLGNERSSPMLRALRIWYPRFSYAQRFLPALYREEPVAAGFMDRFLANVEGVNTVIEGKIAGAQSLFDTRTARPEMLEWLSTWFDVMLDAAWNEERRRLFLRNAATFFGWRGTISGMTLAMRLAFDENLTDADFRLGASRLICPGSIRIVENFSVAAMGGAVANVQTQTGTAPRSQSLTSTWTPAEGAAGLFARLEEDGRSRFPLFDDASIGPEGAALAAASFGFVPMAGARERSAWQAFQQSAGVAAIASDLPANHVDPAIAEAWAEYLALHNSVRVQWQDYLTRRYGNIDKLNIAYGSGWNDFDEIPPPDYLPDREVAIRDWLLFEGLLLTRQRAAHRFSVLLPLRSVNRSDADLEADLALARRIAEIEKPAHTICDVRFYWAMNRLGEARLGSDTELGPGSRAPNLIPFAVLGRDYMGSSFISGPQGRPSGRERLAC